MGRKGISLHRKRLSAQVTYPIKRKHGIFTIRSHPTRGKAETSIPLGIIMREILGYAKTLSEVKKILMKDYVKVDGKIRRSYKFGVGPMDVLEITKTNEFFRLTPYRGKRMLNLHPISKEEAHNKILRIHKKHTFQEGKIQLTFHDGINCLVSSDDKLNISISDLKPKDSVLYNLETKEIEDHYPFAEGNIGLIMGGHNVGIIGKILNIESQPGRKNRTITLETDEGDIKTTDNHILIIGKEKPMIEISTTIGDEEQ
jgi:small subunit ribosomal protein S4e